MAGDLREVRRDAPCPICGKPDWCARVRDTNRDGQEVNLVVCKRDTAKFMRGSTYVVDGADGCQYILVGNSKEGNPIYQEVGEYKGNSRRNGDFRSNGSAQAKTVTLIPKNIIEPRDNAYCAKIYGAMMSLLVLDPKDRTYLLSKGFSPALIDKLGCRSFPENDFLRRKYNNRSKSKNIFRRSVCKKLEAMFGPDCLEGVPGFYETKWGWDIYGFSGILFPMYDISGNTYRLRIRRNFTDVKEELLSDGAGTYYVDPENKQKVYVGWGGLYTVGPAGERIPYKRKGGNGKYRTLSSYEQDYSEADKGFLANRLQRGCRAANACSFYGLDEPDRTIWFITEGEPKAALASRMLASPCVSIPGVDSYKLVSSMDAVRAMMEHGARMFCVAYDADKATNETVLSREKDLCNALKSLNVPVCIADWDIRKGKGIDDALCAGAQIRYHVV